MEVGIDSFAAAFDDNSRAVNPAERLRQLIQQIEHADEVGLDAFGVGEHHRREFLDSAPAVILGAAAVRTQRIRLTSAVTVLSAEDPVRAFQNFATIDLLSRGRAEMIVGRGSSIEAFPLFGFSLDDYDALFAQYERKNLPKQAPALAKIAAWARAGERVALTCYELLPNQCHRHCVAQALENKFGKGFETKHL